MNSTDSGIAIVPNLSHHANASSPIDATELGIWTDSNPKHSQNARSQMDSTHSTAQQIQPLPQANTMDHILYLQLDDFEDSEGVEHPLEFSSSQCSEEELVWVICKSVQK